MVLIIRATLWSTTVKSLHNLITTQDMANLQNEVKHPQIIVFSQSHSIYH